MPGILKKALLAIAAVPLVVEGLQWAAFRAPATPPMNVTLRQNLPGFKPETLFSMDKDFGFRSANWSGPIKAPGAFRVLVVGGESTVGQFQDADTVWWGRLQKLLEQKFPGRRIEVAANAHLAAGSLRGAKWVAGVAGELKPDVILANLGAQDLFVQPLKYTYRPGKLDSMASPVSAPSGLAGAVLKYSQTARRYRASRIQAEAAAIARNYDGDKTLAQLFVEKRQSYARVTPTRGPFRLSENDPKTEYLDALNSLKSTAEANRAKLIITGEPMLIFRDMELLDEKASALLSILVLSEETSNQAFRVETPWFVSEQRRWQEAASEWAAKAGIPFADLHGKVPRDADHFVNETLVTDKGAAVFAEQMLTVVEPVLKELIR